KRCARQTNSRGKGEVVRPSGPEGPVVWEKKSADCTPGVHHARVSGNASSLKCPIWPECPQGVPLAAGISLTRPMTPPPARSAAADTPPVAPSYEAALQELEQLV